MGKINNESNEWAKIEKSKITFNMAAGGAAGTSATGLVACKIRSTMSSCYTDI